MSTAEGGPALNDVNTALRDVDTASTDVDTAATASRACSSRATASADASAAVRAAANESAHEGASKRRKKRALEWSEAERKAYWQAKRQQEKKRRKERPPRALTAQETAARQRQALTRARKRRPLDQIEFRGTLVLDCQFDDLMKRKGGGECTTPRTLLTRATQQTSCRCRRSSAWRLASTPARSSRLTCGSRRSGASRRARPASDQARPTVARRQRSGKLEAQLELVEFRKWYV